MDDPLLVLMVGWALIAIAVLLFWPRRGLFWRCREMWWITERVLIEDALKHLYDAEYQHLKVSVHSLAGALGITDNRAAGLLGHIEALGLLERNGIEIQLTSEGRQYALRLIRIHRLWERYLAEETGVDPNEWHARAEEREHRLSAAETDILAARLGHPCFDPHGAPIPTSDGELPPARRDQPLNALSPGQPGVVVHIEDKPQAIYAQLVAQGLQLGMQVQVVEKTPERILFWAEGEEQILAPVVAANVSVRSLPRVQARDESCATLASLAPGQRARVVHLASSCRGMERQRLMDLGIVPGTRIAAEMRSPAGDPTAYRVRGSLVALRREQAAQIQIRKQTENQPEVIS